MFREGRQVEKKERITRKNHWKNIHASWKIGPKSSQKHEPKKEPLKNQWKNVTWPFCASPGRFLVDFWVPVGSPKWPRDAPWKIPIFHRLSASSKKASRDVPTRPWEAPGVPWEAPGRPQGCPGEAPGTNLDVKFKVPRVPRICGNLARSQGALLDHKWLYLITRGLTWSYNGGYILWLGRPRPLDR